MGWPKLLVFVRHAQSEGNIISSDERAEFHKASHDYDLTPLGLRQAEITAKYVQKRFGPFDVCYTSYYKRTKQTMDLLSGGRKIYEDSRLAEAQRGIWHTMTHAQIEKNYPGEIERKEREGLYHYRPLGGENWPDIEMRIHSFLGTLSRDSEGKNVLVACHGHWLIIFQMLIHHFSIEEAVRRYKEGASANASVTVYQQALDENQRPRLILTEGNIVPWRDKV